VARHHKAHERRQLTAHASICGRGPRRDEATTSTLRTCGEVCSTARPRVEREPLSDERVGEDERRRWYDLPAHAIDVVELADGRRREVLRFLRRVAQLIDEPVLTEFRNSLEATNSNTSDGGYQSSRLLRVTKSRASVSYLPDLHTALGASPPFSWRDLCRSNPCNGRRHSDTVRICAAGLRSAPLSDQATASSHLDLHQIPRADGALGDNIKFVPRAVADCFSSEAS
jgi:hypothetical protein